MLLWRIRYLAYTLINNQLKATMPSNILSAQSRALFLDRDGVININHGYVHQTDNFEFIDGIFDLVLTAHANNFKIVVITNQSGIGRGFYSEQQFHLLTSWMCEKFINAGAPIDKVYFSPFHLRNTRFKESKPSSFHKLVSVQTSPKDRAESNET